MGVGSDAAAHPGGLDRYGCHNNRRTGGYHCHRAQPSRAPVARPRPRPKQQPLLQPDPVPKPILAGQRDGCKYRVGKGDTFAVIAKEHQLSVNELEGLNTDIKDINSLEVGDWLVTDERCISKANPPPSQSSTSGPKTSSGRTDGSGLLGCSCCGLMTFGFLGVPLLFSLALVGRRKRRRLAKEELEKLALQLQNLVGRQDPDLAKDGTKRPLNICLSCHETWFPRGQDRSESCGSCGSQMVVYATPTVKQNLPEIQRIWREMRQLADRNSGLRASVQLDEV
ncbi:MAG: YHYH domain-containing protein [Myxococcota bacterium]